MTEKQDIKTLVSELNCDSTMRCQIARRSLVALGHEAVPALVEALSSDKYWVRWEAAKALSQIGDEAAIEPLVKALKDKEFDVRWLAAEGLIHIGKNAVVPLLHALIEDPKSVWLIEGAHHILHDMDKGNLNEALKPVLDAIEDGVPSLAVPVAAEKALDALEKR